MTKHSHYFKPVAGLQHIDVYRVLQLFGVTDPCIQHACKKLLVTGNRGHKNTEQDIQDAIDTLERWQAMRAEDERAARVAESHAVLAGERHPMTPNVIEPDGPVFAGGCLACGKPGGHGGLQCPTMRPYASADASDQRMDVIARNGNGGEHYDEIDRLQVAAAFNDDIPAEHCLEMVSKVAAQAREPQRPRHLCATCAQGHATHECQAGLGGER